MSNEQGDVVYMGWIDVGDTGGDDCFGAYGHDTATGYGDGIVVHGGSVCFGGDSVCGRVMEHLVILRA